MRKFMSMKKTFIGLILFGLLCTLSRGSVDDRAPFRLEKYSLKSYSPAAYSPGPEILFNRLSALDSLKLSLSSSLGLNSNDKKSGPESKAKWGRATVEYFTMLLYSWPNHLRTYTGRLEEWEFGWNWKDQLRRTFTLDGWRFDSNSFFMNYGHVIAGASYYNIARSNNMDVFDAFLFNIAGSLFWEYIPEWRQVISINDVAYNVFGALSIGEMLFQVSKYFMQKKGFIYRIFEFANPIVKLNNWLDGGKEEPWQKKNPATTGFIDIFLGQRWISPLDELKKSSTIWFGVETRLRSFPDNRRKEYYSGQEPFINLTEARWNQSSDNEGVVESSFRALVQLFSLVNQRIDENHRGSSFSLGLASAFTYYKRRPVVFYDSHQVRPRHGIDIHLENPREFKDKYTAVHILGPRIEYSTYRGICLSGSAAHFFLILLLSTR